MLETTACNRLDLLLAVSARCTISCSKMNLDFADPNAEFSGFLDIFVHCARNIHNICIYDNQDVYAKFSLTYNPDETISTRIINGGGKNPDFNEKLAMKVTQMDAVLKCEIWMLSRARNLLEDQLLGFTLVPISMVAGKGKITEEFSLSSTDLFHSPAGTVKLSLSLSTSLPLNSSSQTHSHGCGSSSITSEVVFLGRKTSESISDPVEYSRIEFPDINVAHQNQQMVTEYFSLAGSRRSLTQNGSFLHLGALLDDSEMRLNSSEENFSSIGVSSELKHGHELNSLSDEEEEESNVVSSPIGKMKIEGEQSAMQQQIVDMYMKSMQQFTESLAKMKLPMNLDKPENEAPKKTVESQKGNGKLEIDKKDGSRVFYGSRAFF